MSTSLIQFTNKEIELLRKTIAPGTSNDQLALFVQVCSQLGLNPFARQIYAVVRKDKMTIQTSIDGYRLLAQRSGEYAGQDGPFWYDPETQEWTDVWIKPTPPAAAKVGVMRKGFAKPIYAVARFDSYAVREYNQQTRRLDGDLSNLWGKMPEVMIAKVCEALALRRAFPAELSGIYTQEEMAQADQPMPAVPPQRHTGNDVPVKVTESTPTQEPERATLPEPTPPTGDTKARLNALFARSIELGLCTKGATSEESVKNFLKLASEVLSIENLTSVGHLTASRLDTIEKYIDGRDAA